MTRDEAIARLNARQQARNLYTNIGEREIRREQRRGGTIKELLQAAGFTIHEYPGDPLMTGIYGSIAPEPYDVGRDHFTPSRRTVFVGKAKGGYYVTSHIHGMMRPYRCRRVGEATVGNVFGKGKTKREAVMDFLRNFTATPKVYNVG